MIGIVRERLSARMPRQASCWTAFRARWSQATALDAMVGGRGPLVVLDIVVPEDVLVQRLASRRICGDCGANATADDAAEACRKCGGRAGARGPTTAAEIVRERLKVYQRRPGRWSSSTRRGRRSGRSTATRLPDAVDRRRSTARSRRRSRGAEGRGRDRLQVAGGNRADARGQPLVAEVLAELAAMARAGRDDRRARRAGRSAVRAAGAEPAFKGYRGYPGDALRVGERGGGARDSVEPGAGRRATSSRSTWA